MNRLIAPTAKKERIPELDFAKGLCIIGLILVHIYSYVLRGTQTDLMVVMVSYLGYPVGAPLFMFCMGATTCLSRHNTPKDHLIRGAALLTLGQVLNLCRYGLIYGLVPVVLLEDFSYAVLLVLVISGDIMQFAGLAFLLLALLGKIGLSKKAIAVFGVALNLLGMTLSGVQSGIYPLDQFFGFFWGTETEACFPLFNWFIFVAVGSLFGDIYSRITDKKRWYAVSLPITSVLSVIFYYFAISAPATSLFRIFNGATSFWWMDIFDALGCIAAILTVLGILWLFSLKFKWKGLCFVSKHINKYYCISYFLIYIVVAICEIEIIQVTNDIGSIATAIIVFTLTTFIILFYQKFLANKIGPWCTKHFAVLVIIVWILSFILAAIGYSCGTEYPNYLNEYLGM